jgi:exonuclease III
VLVALSSLYTSLKQKQNRDTVKLRDVMNQINLTDICRMIHPKTKEYTFLTPHDTFSKFDYIIAHKTTLNRYKMVEFFLETVFNCRN